MFIEIIGIHLLVMQFSHVFAWIVTFLDLYALLFIIADYQAIRLSPVVIDQKGLHFQKGIRQYGFIPFENIDKIKENTKPTNEVDKDKMGVSLVLHGLEREEIPYVLKLNKPVEIYHYFGKRKMIESIYFKMDDTKRFIETIESNIGKEG